MDLCERLMKAAVIICLVLSVQSLKFEETAQNNQQNIVQQPSVENPQQPVEGRQSARHLFDYIGLGTGPQQDPFLRKTNEKCLNGELSECFKSQALNSFDDLFTRDVYV
jgi:hypothetical protein